MRARRAFLYTPGDDLHKIQKAVTLNVDSICLDLEDGVAANRKDVARETVARALKEIDFGKSERLVRINSIDSDWAEKDLMAVLDSKPDGIVVPKVESAVSLQYVNRKITNFEEDNGCSEGSIVLLAGIESPQSIIHLEMICEAVPRLCALVFGAEDLAAGMGAVRTSAGWEVLYARSAVVLHAAAFGLQAIDMVHVEYNNLDMLRKEAFQGFEMGFSGKQIIHPNQVAPVQEAFTPDEARVQNAKRILEMYQVEQTKGKGAFAINGKMVDMPVVRAAENILARAAAGEGTP